MAKDKSEKPKAKETDITLDDRQSGRRYRLSLLIIITSVLLLGFAFLLVFYKDLKAETAFTAIIGLVGTWVGTVLAFYFSKDNFEAASESTRKLVNKVTSFEEILRNTPNKEEMLPIGEMRYLQLDKNPKTDGDDFKLDALLEYLGEYNRLPILDHNLHAKYIIHRSLFDYVISEEARKQGGKPVADLTLKDMEDNEKIKDQITSFVSVSEGDILATTKALMENNSTPEIICSDAFVTKNNKVIGWITNVDLARHARV